MIVALRYHPPDTNSEDKVLSSKYISGIIFLSQSTPIVYHFKMPIANVKRGAYNSIYHEKNEFSYYCPSY